MVTKKETHKELIERLKDSQEADAYFTSVLKDCKNLDKEEADKLLLEALKNLAEARPDDVHVDLNNEHGLKLRGALWLLRFVSRKLV